MKNNSKITLAARALCLASIAFIASCSQTNDAHNSPLSFAPSDSAFVYGNTEPMPFMPPLSSQDAIKILAHSMKGSYQKYLERAKANRAASENNEQATPEETKAADSFAEVVDAYVGGSEKTGIKDQGLSAFYEINGLPVLRIELANTETFKNFVGMVEQATESTFAVKTIDGQAYWSLALPNSKIQAELVAAVQGQQAVFSLYVPAADVRLQTLLGLEKPKQSILDSSEWQAANKDYGLQAYGTFLVRPQKVVERVLGTATTDSWMAQLSRGSASDFYLSSTCRQEMASIAAKVPRIVVGYTKVDASHFDWTAAFALEPQLAASLAQVPVAVPGVGSTSTQELELGFGIDFNKLASVIRTQTQAISAAPYECSQLASLNTGAKSTPQLLSALNMAAPFLNGAHFSGSIPQLPSGKFPTSKEMQDVVLDASLWVSSPDPRGVLGMLQGWWPAMRSLTLQVPQAPKRIDIDALTPSKRKNATPVWFVSNESGLGVAMGNSLTTLEQSLVASPLKTPPVFSQSVRASFYTKILAQGLQTKETDPELAAWTQSYERSFSRIDYARADVFFTGKGIEIKQSMQLNPPAK